MLRSYKDISVRDLNKFHSNSRTHSNEQIEQIIASITEFGFTNPLLVDEHNVIIAGHGRLEAALRLKMATVPCVIIPGLNDAQKSALVIADNKLALNAAWDLDILRGQLGFLKDCDFNLDLTGFGFDELEELFPADIAEAFCGDDETPELPDEPITKLGDLWILGNHRMLCGDSINILDIERLISKENIDLIYTDPPYNVAFKGRSGNFDVIKNDNLSDNDFESFICSVISIICLLKSPYYVWCNWKFYALLQMNLEFTACIVWAKNNFGLGNGYRHQHEFCLTNAKIDSSVKNESDLWSVDKDTSYLHPTQKPVALAERALSNHKDAKNIIDLFGGSGSTLIACEKLQRKCFMLELDPKYCDVIIKRYENYTGNKAVLEK